MNISVKDKVVVITGSSSGIGRELARKFAKEGANVVINYLHNKESAIQLYNEIYEYNKKCILVKADVVKYDEVKKLCKEVIQTYGHVDVLINNAGACSDNLIPMMTERQWKNIIDINLNSIFFCSKVFSKEMIRRKRGKIINIASIKGQVGSAGQTNYSASKAGVIGFTKALAKELGGFNISVNVVCPGFIETNLNSENKTKKIKAKKASVINNSNCLDDLLSFILFISSNMFECVSGRTFNIDSRIN